MIRASRCSGTASRSVSSKSAACFLYERYFNRFTRLFAGADLNGTFKTDPVGYTSDNDRGVFGLMYKLPLNIDSMIWVDTDGGARFRISKDIPLTPRLILGGEVRYDTHEYWEERVHLDYMFEQECLDPRAVALHLWLGSWFKSALLDPSGQIPSRHLFFTSHRIHL
ncbi:MAG: hypothetical protein H0T83_03830 [Chthoniobacterales bacterium]|nr:hypothetical protein [Chthoniobacterales bacterium]